MARRSVVIDLEVRNKQARQALQGVEGGFTRLSQKTQQSTQAMQQGFQRSSQAVRGNIQPVQNMTRIIEDAPFGIRGVANNINPFIESFGRMGNEATSTGQKFKMLLSSAFTGPGALLTISALITSTMTAIQMGLFDWGDEAESADDQMESLMETMDDFISEQREMGGENVFDPLGQASTEQRIEHIQTLRDELGRLFDLRARSDELQRSIEQMAELPEEAQSGIGNLQEQFANINSQITIQSEHFEDLNEEQLNSIDQDLREAETKQALQQAFISLNPAMERQLSLNQALRPVLRDVELGLSGARSELEQLKEGWEAEADQIRENIEAGNFHGEDLEEKKNILSALIEVIEQAEKAEEGLTDQQKSAAEAAKDLAKARRQLMDQARQRAQSDVITDPSQQNTQFSDMGVKFPDMPEGGIDLGAPIGSINEMQNKLKELKEDFSNAVSDEDREKIKANIKEVEGQIAKMQGQSEESSEALMGFANMVGDAFAQAIIHGKELENVLDALIAQLASRALITGIGAILTSGASLGGGTFLEAVFSGFHQGTDEGFPGAGIVGERGKELLVAPPFSSIITNENVERMSRMQQEAKNTATAATSSNPGQMAAAVRQAIENAQIMAITDIKDIDESNDEYQRYRSRVGY